MYRLARLGSASFLQMMLIDNLIHSGAAALQLTVLHSESELYVGIQISSCMWGI